MLEKKPEFVIRSRSWIRAARSGSGLGLGSGSPPPLARFVNPQPGPDLTARIQDGDLITNSVFFFRPPKTACVQATTEVIINLEMV